ncbi:hypothetical protein VNO78_13558 [Psophocarpus tetragonolobus]|uniref:Uncharacterized protein n=1 Tax=Psophocarpus tetragonolobus TaxID=3891 RepID=A0AAN9SP87_PSOTE
MTVEKDRENHGSSPRPIGAMGMRLSRKLGFGLLAMQGKDDVLEIANGPRQEATIGNQNVTQQGGGADYVTGSVEEIVDVRTTLSSSNPLQPCLHEDGSPTDIQDGSDLQQEVSLGFQIGTHQGVELAMYMDRRMRFPLLLSLMVDSIRS